jgi:hypothetical protein
VIIISRKINRWNNKSEKQRHYLKLLGGILAAIISVFTIIGLVKENFFNKIEVTQNTTYSVNKRESLNYDLYSLAEPQNISDSNDSHFFLTNMSTLHNDTSNNMLISDATIEIKKVRPIKQAELEVSYGIHENKLTVFILNNGLGDLKETVFELSASIEDNKNNKTKLDYKEIKKLFHTETIIKNSLYSGDILKSYELEFSKELQELFEKNKNYVSIQIEINDQSSKNMFTILPIYYSPSDKRFMFGGMGAGGPEKTAILFLDVNDKAQKYTVSINKKIAAKSSEQVNVVIIPNQSSTILYSIEYSISNATKTKVTPDIESTITVPLYRTGESPISPFFKTLLENKVTLYKYNSDPILQKELVYNYKTALDNNN